MVRSLKLFLFVALSFSTLTTCFGQEEEGPRLYWVQHYMKVKPENRSEYEQLETEVWKPVHVERKKNERLVDWFFFKVITFLRTLHWIIRNIFFSFC